MKDQRKQPCHFVQVARLRIETTIIGIDADDGANDAGVEREAIETASSLAEENWKLLPFDRRTYEPFVQSIISQEERAEMAKIGSKASITTLVDANEETRYLLLKADCATGEATVVLQPWLNVDGPDLLRWICARGGSWRLKISGSRTCPTASTTWRPVLNACLRIRSCWGQKSLANPRHECCAPVDPTKH
jgi:hypothetical protein